MDDLAHGIDLVEIRRFDELKASIRERFLQRVFTQAELEESGGRFASLAGKFAAKEAAAKALGCGIGKVSWQELEILPDNEGKPILFLYGNASAKARENGWTSWSVSISHTKELALASVIALIGKARER
jgi:holo-[acyl-carrier protein] synthase